MEFTGIATAAVIGKTGQGFLYSGILAVSLLNSFVLTAEVLGKLLAVRIYSNSVGIEKC